MKKILTVLGARPQFIKAAVVSKAIQERYSDKIQEVIVHTGQHYDESMSGIFFQEMAIPNPRYLLNMGGKSHGEMTGLMLIELEKIMIFEKPDIVLVYGDTNSTVAASLSAAKLHIPVAHVEAGMRSRDKKMPEEINRIVCDHVSTYFFCTTEEPLNNLRKENIRNNVYVVGDVMFDAMLHYKDHSKPSQIVGEIEEKFCIATCHRQENTDNKEKLEKIFSALRYISLNYNKVVFPAHPRTKKYIDKYNISTDGIIMAPPISYLEMIYYINKSEMVITDSGGLQREAYYLEKPTIIINDQTEWKELVKSKISVLAGAECRKIIRSYNKLVGKKIFRKDIYGNGDAAEKILTTLCTILDGIA